MREAEEFLELKPFSRTQRCGYEHGSQVLEAVGWSPEVATISSCYPAKGAQGIKWNKIHWGTKIGEKVSIEMGITHEVEVASEVLPHKKYEWAM